MELEVFGKVITDWDESEADCFKEPIQELDIVIKEWTQVYVSKNEITMAFEGSEWSPTGTNPTETMAYYFNIKEEYFDNGGGFSTDDAPEVDWEKCRAFYKKYAGGVDEFITAIDKGNFKEAKRLHELNPTTNKPSVSNSFYARWIVKTGNIEFLKWAKQVDPDIDFGDNPRFENPLKIAIGYNHEDAAIWLIDNYPEIPLTDRYDALSLIKKAKEMKMDKLVQRMLENPDLVDLIVEKGETQYLPDAVKDVFLF